MANPARCLSSEAFTSFCQACQGLKTPVAPFPFCSHCGRPYCLCFLFVFLSCPRDCPFDVSPLLGLTLRPSALVFDTLDLCTFAGSCACCFFVSLICLSNRDVLCEFWQFARNFFSRNVDLWGPVLFVMLFFTKCATCFLSHRSWLLNRDSSGSVEKCVPLDPQDVNFFPCS